MSVFDKIKKGLQFVYGSAELDPSRDPVTNVERQDQQQAAPGSAKDWDRG